MMTKSHLDRLLENAVARGLGLNPPHKIMQRKAAPAKRATHAVKHAA